LHNPLIGIPLILWAETTVIPLFPFKKQSKKNNKNNSYNKIAVILYNIPIILI